MALADTGGAAGMVATLVSLYGRADVPGRIALDNWPGPRAGHRIYRLAPVARLADARTVADPAVGYAAVFVMFWNSIGQSVARWPGTCWWARLPLGQSAGFAFAGAVWFGGFTSF